ncbi:hypothetical protein CC2G_003335 [Coprinopsis cinerea AmutBmut pab1-1]|nr:hypothetical protein CC2G_003335 [Coprinopsis cinerea AmutBmut pab1-1]
MLQAVIHHLVSQYKLLSYPSRLLSRFVPPLFLSPTHAALVEKSVDRSEIYLAGPSSATGQLVWLITGTSTGFGRRLVTSALRRGDLVIATVRSVDDMDTPEVTDPSLLDNLRRIELDVTEGEDALRAKVEAAASIWGRIDVLVNNAGQGLVGLSEEGGSTLFRRTFDVNVFGLVDMTTVTLPYLRASKGCVVNIGSRSAWKTEIVVRGFLSFAHVD